MKKNYKVAFVPTFLHYNIPVIFMSEDKYKNHFITRHPSTFILF